MNNIIAVSNIVIKELYRRKDAYVLFFLTALICVIMGSVNIFHDSHIVRYLKEICLLLIWICSLVIAITTTSRQIPMERENRTLFPLLAKPLTRSQLLLGKFLGCWLACGMSLVCFYLFFGILAATREHEWPVLQYVQAGLLHWTMLGVVVAMVLLGSLVFAAPSSTNTICGVIIVFILLLGRHLDKVAVGLAEPSRTFLYSLYFIIPHLELFDVRDLVIHNWPLLNWGIIGLAILYGAAYTGVFMIAACLVFRRKAIN